MANPFDQFDAAPMVPSEAPPPSVFDQFDPMTKDKLLATAKASGLSDDEIKRNYALKIAGQTEPEPTTLFGFKTMHPAVPLVGGKPFVSEPGPAPSMGLGVLGTHAQGVPIAGALVPNLPSMDWLKREHPNLATAANVTGGMVGAVPAFAAAPGALGMTAMGAGLNAADTAAHQYMDTGKINPSEVAASGVVGGGTANLSRLITPAMKKSPQIPEGVDKFLTKAGGLVAGSVLGHHVPLIGGEGGIAGLLLGEQPGINKWLANKVMAGRAAPYVQSIINALGRNIHNQSNQQ